MSADSRHALASFVYAGAYLGAPLMGLFGIIEGGWQGLALCLVGALLLSAGYVFACQPRARLSNREALFETAFWSLSGAGLGCLGIALLHRLPLAGAGLVVCLALLFATWRQAPERARQRIRHFFSFSPDGQRGR